MLAYVAGIYINFMLLTQLAKINASRNFISPQCIENSLLPNCTVSYYPSMLKNPE
jgi:hypothetical protein